MPSKQRFSNTAKSKRMSQKMDVNSWMSQVKILAKLAQPCYFEVCSFFTQDPKLFTREEKISLSKAYKFSLSLNKGKPLITHLLLVHFQRPLFQNLCDASVVGFQL